jgi:hypothetical protein
MQRGNAPERARQTRHTKHQSGSRSTDEVSGLAKTGVDRKIDQLKIIPPNFFTAEFFQSTSYFWGAPIGAKAPLNPAAKSVE